MSRPYFRVGPSIWLEEWDDDTRYVAFYLLTCEHRSTEGLFRMPVEYALADLRWPTKRFKQAFHELQRTGFIAYDQAAGVCLILKALQWQAPENPNQVKAALKAFERVPPTPLRKTFAGLAELYSQRLAEGLRKGFPELFDEPLAEAFADSLTPSPSPAPTPLTPKGELPTVAPEPPKGNRQRDVSAYRTELNEWVAAHFPGCHPSAIESVIGWVRSRGEDPTPTAVRAFAASAPNFATALEPAA